MGGRPSVEEWVEVDGKPKAGFTTATAAGESLALLDGDGTAFDLRVGPDYKRHGRKAPSRRHMYTPVTLDVFKGKSIVYHVGQRLTLPPPPDGGGSENASGLPRRLIINAIIPAEAPSLMGGPPDGACYQVVACFTASAAALQAWVDEGSEAARLFGRFVRDAPEGVLPTSGDVEVKERLKLLPRVDNMKALGPRRHSNAEEPWRSLCHPPLGCEGPAGVGRSRGGCHALGRP